MNTISYTFKDTKSKNNIQWVSIRGIMIDKRISENYSEIQKCYRHGNHGNLVKITSRNITYITYNDQFYTKRNLNQHNYL